MWSGGVTDYLPLEMLGATSIPYGVGNTRMLLNIIRQLSINSISCTPSYMFTLGDKCKEYLGVDPVELGLKFGFFGGEGLLQVPGVREDIEQEFGMTAYDANYGMSEVLSIIGGEGPKRDGLIFHSYGVLHAELVDENLDPVEIKKGNRGELVFSSLRREGQPLFRYRTNDIAEIQEANIGEDGLLRIQFRIIGRTDEMLNIKGVNFFPQSLLSIITEFGNDLHRDFKVVRPNVNGSDKLIVLLTTSLADQIKRDELESAFVKRVSELFQIKIQIKWHRFGDDNPLENKTRYLLDELPQ